MTTWNSWGAGSAATPKTFLDEARSLLDSVLARVGHEHRATLVAGMAAVVDIDGREASLPLERFADGSDHRGSLARNARAIGAGLVEIALANTTRGHGNVVLRSRCEGHVWTPEVAALLTSVSDAADVMQLYNEWLHQVVLLRDALVPFANWREVPVRVDEHGLRRFTDARSTVQALVLTRNPTYSAIVDWAARAVTGDSVTDAYGFRTAVSTVLPDAVFGGSHRLLRWDSGSVHAVADGPPVTFVAEHEDYLCVPRTPPGDGAVVTEIELREKRVSSDTSMLVLTSGGIDVDLGQALRGLRYAYRPAESGQGTGVGHRSFSIAQILGSAELTVFEPGDNVIQPGSSRWHTLAALGSVVPENIVLRRGEPWSDVFAAGKSGLPRVIVDQGGADRSGGDQRLL